MIIIEQALKNINQSHAMIISYILNIGIVWILINTGSPL